jgi:hypothetical protein
MLRIPHCLDSRLADGGEVVSLAHRPRSTSLILILYMSNKPQGVVWTEGLCEFIKLNDVNRTRTRDLPARSIVPQPLRRAGYDAVRAVFMNAAVFWDIAPCSPYVDRRFGGTYHFHLQGRNSAD